jgi:hypothetical protein
MVTLVAMQLTPTRADEGLATPNASGSFARPTAANHRFVTPEEMMGEDVDHVPCTWVLGIFILLDIGQ